MMTNDKMKTLTIEHLAAYLPYGVIVVSNQGTKFGLSVNGSMKGSGIEDRSMSIVLDNQYKLLLRQLSQDIINRICEKHGLDFTFNMSMQNLMVDPNFDNVPHFIINELLAEHVDIFGLINDGLAIEIQHP